MQSNIRELEGGLNRIVAQSSLTHQPITLEMAQQILSNLGDRKQRIYIDNVIDAVTHHYGVTHDALVGSSRRKDIVTPRQVAMYLARQETNASLPEIGKFLGGRDHSTVLHGSQKISVEIEQNDELRRAIVSIRQELYREPA
jgi:chromosomal replication initiator protein